jgi:predicted TPR repeat methyltransferase
MTSSAQEQSREVFFTGIGHFEAGRLAEARACFERCQALTPGRPSVLGNLGVTLFRLGHIREALPLLQQATDGEPQFGDAWAALGLAHEAQGDWEAAVAALGEALAIVAPSAALWLSLGRSQARLGRNADALQALDRALALDSTLADAWSLRGSLQRELQRFDAAAQSYEQAIAHGADRELHTYYLAAVRSDASAAPPPRAPRQYVQALFDDYAADFQGHLVQQLGYRGHELLLERIVASQRRFGHALDLGCGTGLCGTLLGPVCDTLDGVDLSGAMLEQAGKLGVYRELVQADIGEYLPGATQRVDLAVAADVLIYIGDPSAVFADVARLLEPDGLFAFTVELPTNEEPMQLLPSLRYAHSEALVRRLAAACGLAVDDLRAAPIRHEQGRPVPGLLVTLRQQGAAA